MYKISDNTKRYYPEQIQKINENLYRIEKIIKSRKYRGKKQHYVKWLNYADEYNSWVDDADLKRL